MAGAFLWQVYSICTGETGAEMFSWGCLAERTLSQVSSTLPRAASTQADSTALTMEATVRLAS